MNKKDIAILYVDDEPANLFLFKARFSREYPVYTAESAQVGLKELEDHKDKIIVVISDMRMPQMNGVEFIRKARQTFDKLVYFILTGFEYDQEIEEALNKKLISRFFTKPFDKREIDEAIAFEVSNN
ncbi:MAG: response regulator [Cyclobacteriaceae bacterium]